MVWLGCCSLLNDDPRVDFHLNNLAVDEVSRVLAQISCELWERGFGALGSLELVYNLACSLVDGRGLDYIEAVKGKFRRKCFLKIAQRYSQQLTPLFCFFFFIFPY